MYNINNPLFTSKQNRDNHSHIGLQHPQHHHQKSNGGRESRLRSSSEANLLHTSSAMTTLGISPRQMSNRRHSIAPIDPGLMYETRHHHNHPHNHQHHHHHHHHQQQQQQHAGGSTIAYPVQPVSPQPASLLQPQQPHLQMRAVEAAGTTVKVRRVLDFLFSIFIIIIYILLSMFFARKRANFGY